MEEEMEEQILINKRYFMLINLVSFVFLDKACSF